MNEYRAKIKKDTKVLAIVFVIAVIIILLNPILKAIGVSTPIEDDFSNGFYYGLGAGMISTILVRGIINYKMLRNDQLLKKAYIKSTDERLQLIALKSGYHLTIILVYGFIIIGFLFQYVDLTIFKTLCYASLFVLMVHVVLYIYYNKKI